MNVSVEGAKSKSNRVEIKNVAGAKNVQRAVEAEYLRHVSMLQQGQIPDAQTMRYDVDSNKNVPIRNKDTEPDYRFF